MVVAVFVEVGVAVGVAVGDEVGVDVGVGLLVTVLVGVGGGGAGLKGVSLDQIGPPGDPPKLRTPLLGPAG